MTPAHFGHSNVLPGPGVGADFGGSYGGMLMPAQRLPSAVRFRGLERRRVGRGSSGPRAGLHAGECEARGDDIGGIAVHIGARVSALAGLSEVLVSGTLGDLVIGSGLEFEERGVHKLKGVPGEWHLYAVASPRGDSVAGGGRIAIISSMASGAGEREVLSTSLIEPGRFRLADGCRHRCGADRAAEAKCRTRL